jgi:hypothetical protein
MMQTDAGGRLVDVLASGSARTNEPFLEIAFAKPARIHAPFEFPFLFRSDSVP